MNNRLLKKFLSFSYGNWIGLIIGLLGTMVTTRILDPEHFGRASMYTLALNVSMLFIMFGTDQSFVRFFYEEKEENRGGLLYNCVITPIIISFFLGVVILFNWDTVSTLLFDEENFLVIVLLIVGVIAQTLFRYGTLVIRMQQKGSLYSNIEIANKTLNIATLLLFYFLFGASYIIIIYSVVLNLIILSIYTIFKEKNYWHFNNLRKENLMHSKLEIIKFGSPLVLTSLVYWLFQSFDKIAIKHWSSFDELGLYAAAFKIVALVTVLQTSFSTFWTPVAFEKFQNNPEDKSFFSNMAKSITIAMFFVAIVSIMGKDVIVYLLGENYKQASNIMPFLVFMPLLYTISETTVIGINFLKRPRWHIVIASISCIVNIIGNWLLVPSYGAIGASVSTALAFCVFFSLRTLISYRFYKVDFGIRKLYFMLVLLFSYAFYSIYTTSFTGNIVAGILIFLILILLYKKEIIRMKNSINIAN